MGIDRKCESMQPIKQGTVLESTAGSVVVSILNEELSRRLSADAGVHQRYLEGDDTIAEEAILAACDRAEVTPEDYLTTIEADALLFQLHRAALTEAVVGTADPGPNDSISRESPCGDESNRHFNAWMLRNNSP